MLKLERLFDLDVSAASGLVRDGGDVLVVADDELFVDRYALASGRRVARIPLPLGEPLPEEHAARKAAKPDLECLVKLSDGAVLALGSGSAPGRSRGVLVDEASPRLVELAPLYEALATELGGPNIEGAAVAGEWLRLLHRGNGAGATNAVVDLSLVRVTAAIRAGAPLDATFVCEVRKVALGELDGVPLGFTDASELAPESGRVAFLAAAEDTTSAYDDGACAGTVLGVIERDGRIELVDRFEGSRKLEGLAASPDALLVVEDPDSRAATSALYRAEVPAALFR